VDVLVAFGPVLTEHPWLADRPGLHVVADAYDPAPLEALLQHGHDPLPRQRAIHAAALRVQLDQLRRADLVLCASERQRHLLLGELLALGRLNPDTFAGDPDLERLLRLVPFGTDVAPMDARRPGTLRGGGAVADDAFVLLWGGGVYEWLDPLLLVEAVAAVGDPSVVAYYLGVRHPSPDVPPMPVAEEVVRRAEARGVLGTQVLLADGWTPHAERAGLLVDADVGVSLHHQHVETTFAYRTRVLDYLWAGLPVLCSAGDELAERVAAEDLGEVVPPGDLGALVAAIGRLRDPARRAACGDRARVAGAAQAWDSVAAPLVEYCAAPWRAPDLVDRPASTRSAGTLRRLLSPRR
jgi:glycosyltransferase involved in cell wall biosynthesis